MICLTSFCTGALKSGPTHDPTILARERASHLAPGMTARACSASPDYLFDLEPCYGIEPVDLLLTMGFRSAS